MLACVLHQSGVLNSASRGAELAHAVLEQVALNGTVEIDASEVIRVTPSFANAFVMTVLDRMPDALACGKVRLVASDFVRAAFVASEDRFARGIRLSSQRH